MPTDRYTSFILTVIAVSLSVIALCPLLAPDKAGAQVSGCGTDPHHPCYIAGWGPDGTVPIANSGRFSAESSGGKSIGESNAGDGGQFTDAILSTVT